MCPPTCNAIFEDSGLSLGNLITPKTLDILGGEKLRCEPEACQRHV